MINNTSEMSLTIKLSALHTRLQKKIDQQLYLHGISFTEFMVMYQLSLTENLSMRRVDLAEKVGLTASGVTRLLKPMQKIGLVESKSNPRDARVSLIKLSKAGEGIYADAKKSFEQGSSNLLQPLNKHQVDDLLLLIDSL